MKYLFFAVSRDLKLILDAIRFPFTLEVQLSLRLLQGSVRYSIQFMVESRAGIKSGTVRKDDGT